MRDHDDLQLEPRARLHSRVEAHVLALTELGLAPNRAVSLGGGLFHGWLLDDPFTKDTSRRWLLLPDGDVWCEAAYRAGPWLHAHGTSFGWLTEATPALKSVLELSLDEARDGGSGLLAHPSKSGAPMSVADRRGWDERRTRADRRDGQKAPPGVERRHGDRRAGLDRRRHA